MIGIQTYYDFKVMTYERIEVASKLFQSEIENSAVRTLQSLETLSDNKTITEQFILLNNYGPYFSEDPTSIGKTIEDSDTIFYLQSQLKLAQSLLYLLHQHSLSSLTIYHRDPFSQHSPSGYPLPALTLTTKEIIIYRYASKQPNSKRVIYHLPVSKIIQDRDLFDISSIYQETADHFYEEIGADKSAAYTSHEFNKLGLSTIESSGYSITEIEENFNILIWAPMIVNLTNPDTWIQEKKEPLILVGQLQPSSADLKQISARLGTELSIVSNDRVFVSSMSEHNQLITNKDELEISDQRFLFTNTPFRIEKSENNDYKSVAFSPISVLKEKIIKLIIELTVLTLFAIIITALCIYILIKKTLRSPLELLLKGVESVQQGDFSHKVKLTTRNELSKLARAFNRMTKEIQSQSKELQLMNDSLEQKVKERTEELKDAQQQLILAEKMASLGQLVTGVAHEINTPLGIAITSVTYNQDLHKGISEKFLNQQITTQDFDQFLSDSEESLNLTQKSLTKTKRLIDTFKKVSVDQSTDKFSCFCLRDCIDEAIELHVTALEANNILFKNNIDPALVINTYKNFLFQVISSLITNIIDHAFEEQVDKEIEISADKSATGFTIQVHDNGKGMDQETLKKLFDPFFTTRRGSENTGLGMYTSFNIVTQKLEGEIIADSNLGQGSTITISLPEAPSSPENNTIIW